MKLFDKVWNALGLVEAEESSEEIPVRTSEKTSSRPERKNDHVSEHGNERMADRTTKPTEEPKLSIKPLPQISPASTAILTREKIVLTQPDGFDDSRQIAEHLTKGNLVLVNFERTDAETIKRTIDFMSGITYAVGGTVQRISTTIFLFAPPAVEVLSNDRFTEQEQVPPSFRGHKQGRSQ